MQGVRGMHVTSRREFLKLTAAGAAGAGLTPGFGRAAGKTVTLLHESSFIPPFDEYMKNVLAPAYEKETGVKVVYEIISVGSSPARIASISETGTGADITMNLTLIPFLYDEKYADVGNIAEEMGKEQGGWYPAAREMAVVNGKWKAIPFCSIGQLMNWRSDWFAEIGFKEFPETWDELYEAGKKLKAKGHPFGFDSHRRKSCASFSCGEKLKIEWLIAPRKWKRPFGPAGFSDCWVTLPISGKFSFANQRMLSALLVHEICSAIHALLLLGSVQPSTSSNIVSWKNFRAKSTARAVSSESIVIVLPSSATSWAPYDHSSG